MSPIGCVRESVAEFSQVIYSQTMVCVLSVCGLARV